MFARIVATLAVFASATAFAAEKPKADPEGTPLELTITGKVVKFELDTGGLSSDDYKKKIEDAGKGRGARPPAAPKVDFTVEIKNTSDKPVTVWSKGDAVVLDLELKGKGAVSIAPPLAFTREFRLPVAVELAPGKSVSIPVKSLTSGFRGASVFSYWTAPGEYELVAKLKTGLNPPPKNAKEAGEGFGEVKLTSAGLKLTVEEKK
ncbi:MAG: hypothetical protein U0791_15845 [Gemmataceae bacterium]